MLKKPETLEEKVKRTCPLPPKPKPMFAPSETEKFFFGVSFVATNWDIVETIVNRTAMTEREVIVIALFNALLIALAALNAVRHKRLHKKDVEYALSLREALLIQLKKMDKYTRENSQE